MYAIPLFLSLKVVQFGTRILEQETVNITVDVRGTEIVICAN